LEHEEVTPVVDESTIPHLHTPRAQSTKLSKNHEEHTTNSGIADMQPQIATSLLLGLPTPTSVSRFDINDTSIQKYPTPISLSRNDRMPTPETISLKPLVNTNTRPGTSSSSFRTTPSKVSQKQIEFSFQQYAGWENSDSDNTVSFSSYSSLEIEEFFNICSKRWYLLPGYLSHVVFTVRFGRFLPVTISRGDDKGWELFKSDIEESFRGEVRQKPEKKYFLVSVRMEKSQIDDCYSKPIIIDQ
jgi:hypothetical protein